MGCHRSLITAFFFLSCLVVRSQQNAQHPEKCGTIQRLDKKLQQNAALKARFEQKRVEFNRTLSTRSLNNTARMNAIVYIPVVFHVVMPNPNIITEAQIQAQLDTLNKCFFGANADSSKIPAYFKPLFGKSNIQFCLAQRTPGGESTTGIERVVSSVTSFSIDDKVKHNTSGGTDSWNTEKYLNVWVCTMSNNLIGYATVPNDGSPEDQGVVMDYRSLPGGSFSNFNMGKTLVHEVGHYFNLYHIWGNNSSGCTDGDFVADTPNQDGATNGCRTGIVTDQCTSAGNGIMYQNYMDYTDDACLFMFTVQQVDRMETALSMYRPSLLSSNGCQPVTVSNYDVQLRSVNQPGKRLCQAMFTPQVTIRNRGAQNLNSFQINTSIDGGPVSTYQWTGSLSTFSSTTISLSNVTVAPGNHILTVYVSNPNSTADEDNSNDTLHFSFQYATAVTQLKESFEGNSFPPAGWDIINPDNYYTWKLYNSVAKTGSASAGINNFDYDKVGERDDLRLPLLNLPGGMDSAFFSFQVAAAAFTQINTPDNQWDTLEVLISTDCGNSYTSIYKKWGSNLVTNNTTAALPFFPNFTEWRKDSINLSGFIGMSNLLIAFRNITGFENNLFLDDINLRTVTVNPNLKAKGFLVTPNPANGAIAVQFYPQPDDLRSIQLFNDIGQKLSEVVVNNSQANNYYSFDLSRYAKGMYTVRVLFKDRVEIRKVIKL